MLWSRKIRWSAARTLTLSLFFVFSACSPSQNPLSFSQNSPVSEISLEEKAKVEVKDVLSPLNEDEKYQLGSEEIELLSEEGLLSEEEALELSNLSQ